jgi:ribosomal protein S18 acetylase RimI-like enzyme
MMESLDVAAAYGYLDAWRTQRLRFVIKTSSRKKASQGRGLEPALMRHAWVAADPPVR